MQCEKCQQNVASVHLTDVINNTKHEYHLCKECAKIQGVSLQAQLQKFKDLTLPEGLTLPEFFAPSFEESGSERAENAPEDCPRCKMSYSRFRRDGKFGCSHDYTVFLSTLDELFEKIHESTRHIGRAPARFQKEGSDQGLFDQLREQLKRAVQGEQYEKAAEIRDQMRLMGKN